MVKYLKMVDDGLGREGSVNQAETAHHSLSETMAYFIFVYLLCVPFNFTLNWVTPEVRATLFRSKVD